MAIDIRWKNLTKKDTTRNMMWIYAICKSKYTCALSFAGSVDFAPGPPVVLAGPVPELTDGTLAEVGGAGLETVAYNQDEGVRSYNFTADSREALQV